RSVRQWNEVAADRRRAVEGSAGTVVSVEKDHQRQLLQLVGLRPPHACPDLSETIGHDRRVDRGRQPVLRRGDGEAASSGGVWCPARGTYLRRGTAGPRNGTYD